MSQSQANEIQEAVKHYYGNIASSSNSKSSEGCRCFSEDLDCCPPDLEKTLNIGKNAYNDDKLTEIPPELVDLSLGCGDPITLASLKTGQTVIDLGSGGGFDCFLAASKVGQSGKVIGIDMTTEMITLAQSNQARLGLENVEFRLGEIENLPIDDGIADVIISNCVINLSSDKIRVFQEAFRVLKPGGKLAVSDIVTKGQLPASLKKNLHAWVSCLAGALDVDELLHLLKHTGFADIEIQPYYWDPDVFDSYLERELSVRNPHETPNDVAETEGAKLSNHEIDLSEISVLQRAIFSAKISARKPNNLLGTYYQT